MATSYPVSVDTFTNPAAADKLSSPSHSSQHANANDAIEAIEAYLGTNASQTTPTGSARVLRSTSATASTWAQLVLTTDVTGVLPVANGGTNASSASITAFNNITGYTAAGATGTTSTNLVFSTSPTLVTPLLGTPTSGVLTNCTGLPAAAVVAGTFGTGSYVMDTMLFINDTSNANMTIGLTINQGASDDEILTFKSSDVAHGVTSATETDTFGMFRKWSDTGGALFVRGFADTAGTGLVLESYHPTDNTTKSTAGLGGMIFNARKISGTGGAAVGADGNLLVIQNDSTTRFIFDVEGTFHSIGASSTDSFGNGLWFLNDTSNANVTLGLTLNQGTNTDHILAFKGSDIAHGCTSVAETDTYFYAQKLNGANGGVYMVGIADTGNGGIAFNALVATPSTIKSSAAFGNLQIIATKINGASTAPLGADENIVSFHYQDSTNQCVAIIDKEGDLHLDSATEGTAGAANLTTGAIKAYNIYDEYDDWEMARALRASLAPVGHEIRKKYADIVEKYEPVLSRAGIVTYNDDGHHFVAMKKLALFQLDALWQLGSTAVTKFREQENRIAQLESQLKLLT